jgi:hypothetical protein
MASSRVDLADIPDAGPTLVHVACRAVFYPCYCPCCVGSPVMSGSGCEACARPLFHLAGLVRQGPKRPRLTFWDHRYAGFCVSYSRFFHAVSVEMRIRDDIHTYQRIKSHPDRGTSVLQRLTL